MIRTHAPAPGSARPEAAEGSIGMYRLSDRTGAGTPMFAEDPPDFRPGTATVRSDFRSRGSPRVTGPFGMAEAPFDGSQESIRPRPRTSI